MGVWQGGEQGLDFTCWPGVVALVRKATPGCSASGSWLDFLFIHVRLSQMVVLGCVLAEMKSRFVPFMPLGVFAGKVGLLARLFFETLCTASRRTAAIKPNIETKSPSTGLLLCFAFCVPLCVGSVVTLVCSHVKALFE